MTTDPDAASRPGDPSGPPAGGLRVLVVDDEVCLCELACTWLEALGHVPVGVHSPAQALARLDEGFALLVPDIVMPGAMDGIALAHAAHLRYPHLRVLITSGYARSLLDGSRNLPGLMLPKPYRKADLEAALREFR